MTYGGRKDVVVHGTGSLPVVGAGSRGVLSGIVSAALTVARKREKALSAERFRIGKYEFREPDYSQILIWSKALGIEPAIWLTLFRS